MQYISFNHEFKSSCELEMREKGQIKNTITVQNNKTT